MSNKLKAILGTILFQFEDDLGTGQGVKQFKEKTNWGFDLLTSFDHNLKAARWGIVVSVGPNVHDVKQGMRVLVEPLKWTEGMKFEGQLYWATKEENILLIQDLE